MAFEVVFVAEDHAYGRKGNTSLPAKQILLDQTLYHRVTKIQNPQTVLASGDTANTDSVISNSNEDTKQIQ